MLVVFPTKFSCLRASGLSSGSPQCPPGGYKQHLYTVATRHWCEQKGAQGPMAEGSGYTRANPNGRRIGEIQVVIKDYHTGRTVLLRRLQTGSAGSVCARLRQATFGVQVSSENRPGKARRRTEIDTRDSVYRCAISLNLGSRARPDRVIGRRAATGAGSGFVGPGGASCVLGSGSRLCFGAKRVNCCVTSS